MISRVLLICLGSARVNPRRGSVRHAARQREQGKAQGDRRLYAGAFRSWAVAFIACWGSNAFRLPRSLPRCMKVASTAARIELRQCLSIIHRSPMRVSKAASISRMQVGLVTLISVRCSPITSRPTNSRPFHAVSGRRRRRFHGRVRSAAGLRHGRRRRGCHGFRLAAGIRARQ